MPDDPIQSQTPGQVLAGQQQTPPPAPSAGNAPPVSQPGQPPSASPAHPPVQQQAPPTPQQAVAAQHHALGQVTSFLFGKQRDPQTGAPIKQPPGTLFRSLLAGALLGGAIGSESPKGGFFGGLARGGAGVEQQQYQRQQQAQENARKQQQQTLEEQKFEEEKTQNAATLEHWNMENIARGREADYRDREELRSEEAQEENVEKWATENNAYLAPIVPQNGVAGNGPALMKAMVANPAAFQPPAGMGRLITKHYDFDGLDHDSKNGWTENGKPVDWSKHLTWNVYYVPPGGGKVSMTGSDWQKFYHVNGLDPNKTYSVDSVQHLVAAASTERKNDREDFNQNFKEQHDALNATINSARTNVTQLDTEKRELIRQGYTKDDDEVQELDEKIAAEQKRETDAIGEMHPRIRERVTKQTPAAQPANKPAGRAAPASVPKKGDTQTHAGFSYTFDGKQWVKGQPVPPANSTATPAPTPVQ
ncbi:MAG: hypothetical protein WB683_05100 [Candidatus Sulfotelmatobacter sp.]